MVLSQVLLCLKFNNPREMNTGESQVFVLLFEKEGGSTFAVLLMHTKKTVNMVLKQNKLINSSIAHNLEYRVEAQKR